MAPSATVMVPASNKRGGLQMVPGKSHELLELDERTGAFLARARRGATRLLNLRMNP